MKKQNKDCGRNWIFVLSPSTKHKQFLLSVHDAQNKYQKIIIKIKNKEQVNKRNLST